MQCKYLCRYKQLNGCKVWFTTALALTELLEMAEMKRELKKKINQLFKFDLIIIDELG